MEDLVEAARERAGKIGCDAIVITATSSGAIPAFEGFKAACIVWNSPDPKTASTESAQGEEPKPSNPEPTAAPASDVKPDGAAGFTFGQSLEAVQAACTGANHQWAQVKGARYSCSGAPKSVGLPATLVLRFCQNRLCEVNVDPQSSDPKATFRSIQTALAGKYGEAKKVSEDVPEDCSAEQLAKCIGESRATLLAEWWWETGERITEKVLVSETDGSAALRITYSKWPLDPPEPPKGEGL